MTSMHDVDVREHRSAHALGLTVFATWLLFVAATLLPDVGRGFVKDDFSWITTGRAGLADPVSIVKPTQPGFYRPLVAASFALSYRWFGLTARLYGITNLLLYGLCAASIVLLIRQIRVSWVSALVGAFAWAINPHGIGMAVLWISGRTSLLLTLTAALAALTFLRGYRTVGLGSAGVRAAVEGGGGCAADRDRRTPLLRTAGDSVP